VVNAARALDAVTHYIDSFNNGDSTAMASVFDSDATILDGMAPHVWHGPAAATDWYRDVLTEAEHVGASDYAVTLGEPLHNAVTADRAYIVAPATMEFTLKGRRVTQTGAWFTVALRRLSDGWRISAWAWTKGVLAQ
jgi:ketosteroid isomerase-like protein